MICRDPQKNIAITMGCPVGIGPEIILRFMADPAMKSDYRPVVIGDPGVLARCASDLGIDLDICLWQPGQVPKDGCLNVFSGSDLAGNHQWGQPGLHTGRAMGEYIEQAVKLIFAGEMAGLVTCPITKSALNKAGYIYPGHTEMLAFLCDAPDYAMMMAGNKLRVTLVTIHEGMAAVPRLIDRAGVLRMIKITGRALRVDFGISHPRIAVAGLNPHAGEAGMFGDEEISEISPAIAEAVAQGWDVQGPFPPDTVFNKAVAGQFDAVVCMYHDQGLIPFKLLHFEDGVNVTLGLPIVRTSVDHGTAYDIAGQGIANPASLAAAFRLAGEIVQNRKRR
ncbi:MAG: 4-hydroxythreonine-4-phosphate dehydrogenase PdxA [Proteobacteria bacterium]|nr:4-hydroxythreonine-4-phosphate dehydrogenase PdxA [Pseudomonadota bacterium]MBU1714287.1 4-hydroxythreonine-4-phosphate dehydrogenase PdxA [Pseudomonadota bacterium]